MPTRSVRSLPDMQSLVNEGLTELEVEPVAELELGHVSELELEPVSESDYLKALPEYL